MTILYRLGTTLYHAGIRLAALAGNPKAKLWWEGRENAAPLPRHLRPEARQPGEKLLWVHCASLGEWEQGRPVVDALLREHPNWKSVLTFYSPSGYERRKNDELVDFVTYLPPDGPAAAAQWQETLRPDLAVFVKYEFWYYHLRALSERQIPCFLVAASFRANQRFFQKNGGWWRQMLGLFTGIVTQTEHDARLIREFTNFPTERIRVCGDPRMDRTIALAEAPFSDDILAAFTEPAGLTIIAGSVWPDDLQALWQSWEAMPEEVRIVLAPHELHEHELARTRVQWQALRYTESTAKDVAKTRVLLLDTIGILSRAYRYGDIAYVGGAFRTGLHNTLEPLAYGLPTVFGPRHDKFPEAAAAIAAGGAFAVTSGGELRVVLQELLNEKNRTAAARAQLQLAMTSAGAARRTAETINHWMHA